MKKLALAGCAHIHTPGFVKTIIGREDVQVVKVWDHDPARAALNGAKLSAPVVADPTEIWQDEAIDGVVISSETDRHQALVAAGSAAGKHLFVEKPLGMGAADSLAMAAELDAAGVLFQTGYFMRGFPHFIYLRQAIAQGHFGQITRLRLSNCHSGSLGDWFTPEWLWMTDPAVAGVGAFGDLGTHILDILLWMTAEKPIARLTAMVDTGIARYGDKCDEYGEGMIQFEDGMLATLAAGWVDVADPVKLVLSGTEGYAHVIGDQLFVKSAHIDGCAELSEIVDMPPKQPHAFDLFLDAIAAGQAEPGMLVTPAEAARRSVVMEKMYQAAQNGTWVA